MDQKSEQLNQAKASQEEIQLLDQRNQFHQFMAECSACQEEIESNWQYCAHCGTRLATKCPGCGNPLPPVGAHSCPSCGLEIPQVNVQK
ncbi:zinc ribbon domain-containing protein [Chloroflexi bacterium TSY]|nr:zinc ribbon domain-containing protein [Chloroflexi bacterium TSY]